MDIEGAGELVTKITYTGSTSKFGGTVTGASDAELRSLTVENTGGADYATAICTRGASPRLTRVTATASGAAYDSIGVGNYAYSAPAMTDVTVRAGVGPSAIMPSGGLPDAR